MSKKKKNSKEDRDSQKQADASVSKITRLVGYLLIAFLIAFAYSTSFSGVFVRDGILEILENQNIHSLESPLKTMFEGNVLPARPIPYLTFAINYTFHGENVWGYHFVNVLLHIGSALLLFGIVSQSLMLPSMKERFSEKTTFYLSWIITSLWAVHPVLTEAMNYIYQRMELLVSFFFLATLYSFIQANTSSKVSIFWAIVCVVCCALGMLSKEIMVTAPLVLLWYDRVFLVSSWKELRTRRSLIYLPLFSTWLIIAFLVQSQSERWKEIFLGKEPSSWNYLMTQAEVIPWYFKLLIIPHPLCFEYGWPIQEDFSKVILPGLFVVFLVVLTFWAMFKRPKFGFLAGSVFLILAPTSTIKPIYQPAAEYRLYLAASAFIALVVMLLFSVGSKYLEGSGYRKRIKLARGASFAFFAILFLFVITTRERNKVYSSIQTLWEDTAVKAPQNPVPFFQIGTIHARNQNLEEAEKYYIKAAQLKPDDPKSLKRLGNTQLILGKTESAISFLTKALEVDESNNDSELFFDLGICYLNRSEFDKAEEYFKKAHEVIPESPLYLAMYAAAIGKDSNRINEAEDKFLKAIQLNPDFAKTYYSFGIFLLETNRLAEAANQVRICLQINPNFVPARRLYSAILQKQQRQKKKIGLF